MTSHGTSMMSFSRTTLAILLIGGIVILAAAWFFLSTPVTTTPPDTSIHGCLSIDRAQEGIPLQAFESLPPAPACMMTLVKDYQRGAFTDIFFFPPEMYLQPEFYPNFSELGKPYWLNPLPGYWGAVGFGAFPTKQSIELEPGQMRTLRFFFHSGFGVRTHQGLKFGVLFSDPSQAHYVDVQLAPEVANGFLIGPTFPKFAPDWVKVVDVNITALPGSAGKKIDLSLQTLPPNDEENDRFAAEWGSRYFQATQLIGSRTPIQIGVRVQ